MERDYYLNASRSPIIIILLPVSAIGLISWFVGWLVSIVVDGRRGAREWDRVLDIVYGNREREFKRDGQTVGKMTVRQRVGLKQRLLRIFSDGCSSAVAICQSYV